MADTDNDPEGAQPSRRRLGLIVGGGLIAAAAVTVLFVLPVEYGVDPTGFGRATGLGKLAEPKVIAAPTLPAGAGSAARAYPMAYRTDTFAIALTAPDTDPDAAALEYKVRMKPGESLVYSWTVSGLANPEEFYADFHAETPAVPGGAASVNVEYRKGIMASDNGALVAPIDGVHGWYLQNQSAKPVVVHLKIAGFYELVPAGEVGNKTGVKPVASS